MEDLENKNSGIGSGKRRLEELRETRRVSAHESVSRSRTTVLINIGIELVSACIYLVGISYAFLFLSVRKPFMDPLHYRLFIGAFLAVSAVWLTLLARKVIRNILRYREITRQNV